MMPVFVVKFRPIFFAPNKFPFFTQPEGVKNCYQLPHATRQHLLQQLDATPRLTDGYAKLSRDSCKWAVFAAICWWREHPARPI
jgi:hypothetical protein